MTWRQIKPEQFKFGNTQELKQAIATLEHLGSDSQPDGQKAHIIVNDSCYMLCVGQSVVIDNLGNTELQFKPNPWLFWEAVQAIRSLPHPDNALEWLEKGFL